MSASLLQKAWAWDHAMDLPWFGGVIQVYQRGFEMPKARPPCSPEFCRQRVDLVRAGRLPEALSREFELTAQLITIWVAQADKQDGRWEGQVDGLCVAERDELARLRRENKQLRLERDIFSRAAGWFARETAAVPSGFSGS